MLYQDINTIIAKNDASLPVAESHGMAAGMLCVNVRTKPEFWLRELLQDAGEPNVEDRTILENLIEETRRLLNSDEFTFELLLPDEDAPLSEQVDALREWGQGFLFGLGSTSSSSGSASNWPEDIREVVKDIAEFTRLERDAEGEEAENDFMELTEYLRAAVIFLRTGLNAGYDGLIH
ncbi:UPF0149 family protein [Methyloglobulus sp.]|uniref:UPF0149 family protein n=1 Tax=Methyloglobulus sp. TaxID=2518622 RepID=UPI00398A00C1